MNLPSERRFPRLPLAKANPHAKARSREEEESKPEFPPLVFLRAFAASRETSPIRNRLTASQTAAFTHFQTAWANHPTFRGDEVRVHRHPHLANSNRWNTYWHCVTEGEPETTRTVSDPRQVGTHPMGRPVIENETDTNSGIKVWANVRGRDQHVCVWFEPENYLIVLKIARNHFVLKTTYRPESNRRAQLHRDYTAWKKTGREF